MIGDKKKLSEQRDKAWQTAKSRSFERRAYLYQKLYREVLNPNETSVSVVVPVYDKPEIIRKCLNAIAEQTHKNIEVIVCDDSLEGESFSLIRDFAKYVSLPVRYMNTAEVVVGDVDYIKDYGLARGRNAATIEATGEVMVYCDQRMIMEPNAIEEFLKYLAPRKWLFGNKGGNKTTFIENFSCINRGDIINAGMFNERITLYGGMSQELRERMKMQGIQTEYVASAKATPTGKSSNRNKKRADIIKMKNKLFKMGMG
jgi:glycosyltransferase involved in cell wall biosynthesis